MGRHDPIGLAACCPAPGRHAIEVWSELLDQLGNRRGQSGHYVPRFQSASCTKRLVPRAWVLSHIRSATNRSVGRAGHDFVRSIIRSITPPMRIASRTN